MEIETKAFTKEQRDMISKKLKELENRSDYEKAKELGLVDKNRWEEGRDHHYMSRRLMNFICEIDYNDYDDYFCWKVGGDGDNGETLMYELDAFFELMDEVDKTNRKEFLKLLDL